MANYKIQSASESLFQCASQHFNVHPRIFPAAGSLQSVLASELGKSWLLGEETNPDRNLGLRISWSVLGFTEKTYFQFLEYEEAFLIIELFMSEFWRTFFLLLLFC